VKQSLKKMESVMNEWIWNNLRAEFDHKMNKCRKLKSAIAI
jgi:hypothetical protein